MCGHFYIIYTNLGRIIDTQTAPARLESDSESEMTPNDSNYDIFYDKDEKQDDILIKVIYLKN